MKPKLLPVVRRFGLLEGIYKYLHCRDIGHNWISIDTYPVDVFQEVTYPLCLLYKTVASGKVKFKCTHCESVKIERILVWRKTDGSFECTTENGDSINIIPKPHTH